MNTPNGGAADPHPGRSMRRSISQLGSDVITLVELQAQLLQVDAREWASTVVRAIAAFVAAAVVLLASLPILLLSVAHFINQGSDFSLATSMLIAGAAGLLIAVLCAGFAMWMLKRDRGVLQRFSTELKQNVAWLKQALTRPSTADPAYNDAP